MTKIAYNTQYGGFSLSQRAITRYVELGGLDDNQAGRSLERSDPKLIQVLLELGEAANGQFATIDIRDLPPGVKYRIDEYDGNERVVTIDEYTWLVA